MAAEAGGAVDELQLEGFLVFAVKFGQGDEIQMCIRDRAYADQQALRRAARGLLREP